MVRLLFVGVKKAYSLRPGHRYLKVLDYGANAANDLAGPQMVAQQGQETVLEISNGAEEVSWEGRVISVHAAAGQAGF